MLFLLSSAFAASATIAAVTISRKRRRVQEKDHPLKGSLDKRIRLFSSLAAVRVGERAGKGVLDAEIAEGYRMGGEDGAMGIAVV
jgi:hypothetical protein